jgi:hypothetical protein
MNMIMVKTEVDLEGQVASDDSIVRPGDRLG